MFSFLARRPVAWFLLLSFGISWPLFVLPLAFGAPGTAAHGYAALVAFPAAMWGPGLAALAVTRAEGGPVGEALGLKRLGPRRVYLWAWLLPLGLTAAAGVLTWVLGLGRLDLAFTAVREAMADVPGGDAVPAWVVVLLQVVASLTLVPVINTLFALGEELGWRAFLLSRLQALGPARAFLTLGVVWGLWHAPAILQGHNYPEHPVLGVGLMVVAVTPLGIILGWLWLRTRSAWAPALGHGAVNAVAGLPVLFLVDVDLAWGGTLVSLSGAAVMAAFAAWLVGSGRLRRAWDEAFPQPAPTPAPAPSPWPSP